ncbi:PD40 domain-containing protein [Fluviicola taffensis]|uniref:WD40-like beta Propeller containing protein n=1 Tax=Fluviicola taffensis (strain DSM 16823 / NCIMB 13979 / RW262) TaxID=755732 RepID=F2IC74_FLUTR|nr:PD40 domain-containing protein [Fluviicola taffensis]AEA44320.1 WD40-like beta Propeller containing protein [Fluviicola taffensis DSM 16823]
MKILFGTLLLLLVSTKSFALTANPKDSITGIIDKSAALIKIDQGKQLVTDNKIREALLVFREAAIKDPNTWKASYWISFCHYRLKNFGYAKQYGVDAITKGPDDVDAEIYDILGVACQNLNELDSAATYFQLALKHLSKARAKDLNIEHKIASVEFAKQNATQKNLRLSLLGDVNSGYNDYSPVLTSNGKRIYFTSRRANTTGGLMNPDDQEYFEDVYTGVWNEKMQKFDSISNNVERINGPGFESMSWMSKDGLHAFVTLNNTATSAKKMTGSSDICEVEFTKKGKWNVPKVISNKSINSSFFEGSAALTADGNTMYFVSDRKGDKRSTDIYVVQRTGKKWGDAKILSDSINSDFRETTPFISADGRFLFFSSEGHVGMGGLDVFVSENTGTGWTKAKNLGGSVNSVNDDTHFVIYKELGKAYLSGLTINEKKSSIDIFEIDLSKLILPVKL